MKEYEENILKRLNGNKWIIAGESYEELEDLLVAGKIKITGKYGNRYTIKKGETK